MYWKICCKESAFKNQFGEFIKIEGNEIKFNSPYWVYIKYADYREFNSGKTFIEVFENYPEEVRNFLLVGIAPTFVCQNTGQEKIIHKAYVTNAVANSVVFYAMSYLNNIGLSLSQIIRLREKYALGNLEKKFFSAIELRDSFVNQSAFFVNLYKSMNENDRFENFVDNLEDNRRFQEIFMRYQDGLSLKKQYNRRIFHNKFECRAMRSDYQEAEFHENTGVFVESKIAEQVDYYVVEMPYLEELKMRVCKMC